MTARRLLFYLFIFVLISAHFLHAQEIHRPSQQGDMEKVIALLAENPALVKAKDQAGRTPLHLASNGGHLELVKLLLTKGADLQEKTNAGTTALHYAALSGSLEVVEFLAEKGAPLEVKNVQTATPLYYGALRGHVDVVRHLIAKGALVDALDREEGTPLHAASQAGHLEVVKLLLANGAELKKKDLNDLTAMHFACASGNRKLVELLIEKTLAVDEVEIYGKTPLYYAAVRGHRSVVQLLLEKDVKDLQRVFPDGNTYLHGAASGGLAGFAEVLIAKGLKVNSKNLFNATPLDLATKKNHTTVANLLIEKGAAAKKSGLPEMRGNYFGQKPPESEPVLFAPGIVSTGETNDRDVAFSSKLDEFYFTQNGAVHGMKMVKGAWSKPEPASFSRGFQTFEAYFTPDDEKLFFISTRPKEGRGRPGPFEIWFVAREGEDWSAPQLLGHPFEGGYYTTFTDGWVMYYTGPDTDLYRAKYEKGKFSKPENLGKNVNTKEDEYNAFVSRDESYLIFSSRGWKGSFGSDDLYICFRRGDGTWTQAKNMGPRINTRTREYCPSVSPEGKYFFFTSRKLGTEDIYWMDAGIIEELRAKQKMR